MRRELVAVGTLMVTMVWGPAAAGGDALVLYSAGLEEWLVDDKDRGLLEAIRLIDDRIAELPAQLDAPDIPVPLIQLALELKMSPFLLRVGFDDDAAPGGPPFYVQMVFRDSGDRNGPPLSTRVGRMIQMMAEGPARPLDERPGISVIDLDGMPLYYGSEKPGEVVVALNRIDDGPDEPPHLALPAGAEPIFTLVFDGRAAQPFIQMMLAMMGPGGDMVREQLELYNLAGPEASSFLVTMGHGADRAYGVWRYTNYVPLARRLKTLVDEPLTRRDMQMIPQDATFVQVGRAKLSAIGEYLRPPGLGEMDPEDDPIEMLAAHTGIHLERDLLNHLGESYGFYMSDTTGGGGLMSSVLFLEVTDADALGESLSLITDSINRLARQHAKGYVRVGTAQRQGLSLTTLTFPGLPVPLELSWTISRGYLIAGATPQAVVAAVAQARGDRRSSLLDNKSFRESGGRAWKDAIYVSFTDTPRLARAGYDLAQLLGAAFRNAVRSPGNPDRDPGAILPPFNEFLDGAKASVSIYRIEGDDLVGEFQSDRSAVVNGAGILGMFGGSGGSAAMVALAGGVALPAIAKAQENARVVKSMAQARMLAVAMQTYAADHDDAVPASLDALRPYIEGDGLSSPFGPVSDGRGDFWINTKLPRLNASTFPDRQVAIYDRAMYESGVAVAVCFFDGHVETLDTWEFDALINKEPNAGTEFDRPGDW